MVNNTPSIGCAEGRDTYRRHREKQTRQYRVENHKAKAARPAQRLLDRVNARPGARTSHIPTIANTPMKKLNRITGSCASTNCSNCTAVSISRSQALALNHIHLI
jgi:hypothetical protein